MPNRTKAKNMPKGQIWPINELKSGKGEKPPKGK
jgi:hypothetical protein